MRTFSRIGAHQSTSDLTQVLKEENKASFCQLLRHCGFGAK